MMFFINNEDWYIILLFALGVFLGKVLYSVFSGILQALFLDFLKVRGKE